MNSRLPPLEPPPALDEAFLQNACARRGLPWRVLVLAETASTNDFLRERGRMEDTAYAVVFAEKQTAGRGRRDHTWEAAPGRDLTFSLALRPALPLHRWTRFTQMTALAVCRAIEGMTPLSAAIKWPNDIFIGGRKVCGILTESFSGSDGRFLVIGIGLNVNRAGFDGELWETATSLRLALADDAELDRNALAARLLEELAGTLTAAEDDTTCHALMREVKARNVLLGRQARLLLDGQERQGLVTGLDDEGALLVKLPGGDELAVTSAEQVRIIDP